MAQVSIQYALHKHITAHDDQELKQRFHTYTDIMSISINIKEGILCIDFDDTSVKKEMLEEELQCLGYTPTFIDLITF